MKYVLIGLVLCLHAYNLYQYVMATKFDKVNVKRRKTYFVLSGLLFFVVIVIIAIFKI